LSAIAETSLGPDEPEEPDDAEPFEPKPFEEPEPPFEEPEPPFEEPEPPFEEPEPALPEDADDEAGDELDVQAAWPIPTPAARATTAAAPIIAAVRRRWPVFCWASGSGCGVQPGKPGFGGGPP
jgi:hypothetical protein